MKGLLFDTSLPTSLTALTSNNQVILQCRRKGDNGHSATLLRDVENLLQEAGWDYNDLDFIAAGVGPGSFTGVRVSVSTAKGLAFTLKKPVIAVCTLDAIAAIMPVEMPVAVMIDAGRQRVYAANYPEGTIARKAEIRIIPLAELAHEFEGTHILAAGPALLKYRHEIETAMGPSLAGVMDGFDGLTARGFLQAVRQGMENPMDPGDLVPLYLQEPTVRKRR